MAGFADGQGAAAQFNVPIGIAIDSTGNVYVADTQNNRVRKISPDGEVTTLAGSGMSGNTDGQGTAARFDFPTGVAVGSAGNIYVADTFNHLIRKISPDGEVTTLAGSTMGFADGQGTEVQFNMPYKVVVDSAGNICVADFGNNRIRKISPDGNVSTLAGNSAAGFADGQGAAAQFNGPIGITLGSAGNIYVADFSNNRIRKVSPDGYVTTLAGSGMAGFTDGQGAMAQFNEPVGVAVDSAGNVYVADQFNDRIRKISPDGNVSTLAGDGTEGYADGQGTTARFNTPMGVAVDSAGNIYVADSNNNRIRKLVIVPVE
jgi:sugar lactone lactonase YvrE